jgi:hypothetical protein
VLASLTVVVLGLALMLILRDLWLGRGGQCLSVPRELRGGHAQAQAEAAAKKPGEVVGACCLEVPQRPQLVSKLVSNLEFDIIQSGSDTNFDLGFWCPPAGSNRQPSD